MLIKKKKKKNFDFLKLSDPLRYCLNTYEHGVVFNNSNIARSGKGKRNYTILNTSTFDIFENVYYITLTITYRDKNFKQRVDHKIIYNKSTKEYAEIICDDYKEKERKSI